MSKENHYPDRRFYHISSSHLVPPHSLRPGEPTIHRETVTGMRIISLGEPITPYLPKHKAHFDTAGTPWTETTVLLDSHLRMASGTPFPRLPLILGTVGECFGARIKQEHLVAYHLLEHPSPNPADYRMKQAALELFSGLSMTLVQNHATFSEMTR